MALKSESIPVVKKTQNSTASLYPHVNFEYHNTFIVGDTYPCLAKRHMDFLET